MYEKSRDRRNRGTSYLLLSPDDDHTLRSIFGFLGSDPQCSIPAELELFFLDTMVRSAKAKRDSAVKICPQVKVTGKCRVISILVL